MTNLPPSPTPATRSERQDEAARSASKPSERRISLLIADPDADFRRQLRASIAQDHRIDVVGEADDGVLAIHLARWLRPDVALVDEEMPNVDGPAILRILSSEAPLVRVVLMRRPMTESTA